MINWLQTRVCQELGQEYGSRLWMDAQENIRLYAYYDGTGQEWATPAGLDYRPNKTIVNHTKRLIDKVSGFMFSRAPEITLKPVGDDQANAKRVAELEPAYPGNPPAKRLAAAAFAGGARLLCGQARSIEGGHLSGPAGDTLPALGGIFPRRIGG